MTRQGNFQGVEIGHEVFSEEVERKIRKITRAIGEAFSDFGYRGFFEVDMQAAQDGEIYCLEANMRRTGGTHVFQGIKRLFGTAGLEKKYVASNNWYPHPCLTRMTYQNLKDALKDIWFSPATGVGFLPTIVSSFKMEHLGYMVIGNSRKETDEIEEKLKKMLDNYSC